MSSTIKHKGKAERHKLLSSVVSDLLPIEGQENVGRIWVVKSRNEWADLLGVSPPTITNHYKIPPLEGTVFLVENEQGKRVKGLALRLLQPGERPLQDFRDNARIMEALFKKFTEHRVTKAQWGMLNGLAGEWPDGHQIDIFKHLLSTEGWISFMAALDQHIAVQNETEAKEYEKRFYRFSSINVMRAFPKVAADVYKSDMQQKGKDPAFPYYYDQWVPVC